MTRVKDVLERETMLPVEVGFTGVIEYASLPDEETVAGHVERLEAFVVRGYVNGIATEMTPLSSIVFGERREDEIQVLRTREGHLFAYMQDVHEADAFDVNTLRWPANGSRVDKISMPASTVITYLESQTDFTAKTPYVALTKKMPDSFSRRLQDASRAIYDNADGARARVARLWVGRSTTTHTHYDESHNVYAQLGGEKLFVLFPPELHVHMKTYPEGHPGYRQARVSGLRENVTGAYATFLRRGDLLYLPPLTYHRVTALESDAVDDDGSDVLLDRMSISCSVWTESEVQVFNRHMRRMGIPMLLRSRERETTVFRRLAWFVGRLTEVFLGDEEQDIDRVVSYLRRVVLVRYAGYLEDEMRCLSDEQHIDMFPSLDRKEWFEDDKSLSLASHAEDHIRRLQLYFDMSFARPDKQSSRLEAVREMMLADALELYVRSAHPAGTRGVCAFFRAWVEQAPAVRRGESFSFEL